MQSVFCGNSEQNQVTGTKFQEKSLVKDVVEKKLFFQKTKKTRAKIELIALMAAASSPWFDSHFPDGIDRIKRNLNLKVYE